MNITVNYTTQLRLALERSSDVFELAPDATVQDLFDHISELHGDTFDKLARSGSGQLNPSLLICIGDQCIGQECSVKLEPGSEITLLSPVSGG